MQRNVDIDESGNGVKQQDSIFVCDECITFGGDLIL